MLKWLNIALIFVSCWAFGQSSAVEVAVSKTTVTSNEPFTYQISSDCNCSISPPDLSDFDILDKQQGQFSGTNNINGVVTKSCTTTLTYVLKAKKKGTFNIGKANIKCKKDKGTSKEIKMTVVDANSAHAALEGTAPYYFKIESNKKSVLVGEPFVISFYLYTDQLPEEISAIVPGNAVSLWRHGLYDETAPDHAFPRAIRKVKGKEYHVIELKKEVCYASNPGNIHIDAYFGRAVLRYGFFENEYMEGYSNELDVKVKDIPGSKPENYTGMSGKFEMTHEISETSVPANHAIEMKVRLEGVGNFDNFQGPEFLFPKDSFIVNPPEIEENFKYTENGIEGWVEYTYLITPIKQGDYLILPYSFTYFDWTSRQMKAVSTHDFVLHVSKGKEAVIIPPENQEGGTEIETDIRHIHPQTDGFFMKEDIFFGTLAYWLLLISPMSLVLFIFFWKKRKANLSEEKILVSEQKSNRKTVVKNLQKIQQTDGSALDALKTSLEEYLMTNLDLSRSALSKQNIVTKLAEKGVDDSTQLAFSDVWGAIEMAKYAPISEENVGALVSKSEDLIKNLNQQL